jgi:hypothetical protein
MAERIDKYIARRNRYPKNVTVANSTGITKEKATEILNEHKRTHGKRIRSYAPMAMGGVRQPGQDSEPESRAVPEDAGHSVVHRHDRKWIDVATKATDWLIDSGTIFTAVIIDLVLSGICLYIMGPSALEKVAFVAIAFIIVLFGLRALVRGNFRLWLMCAILAGFLDTSFVLVGIDYQTNRTASDRELTVLETAEDNASKYLEELKAKQLEKGEGYKGQIEAQQIVFDKASAKASEYRAIVANNPKEAPTIKAYDIFLAIPNALVGSWVVLGPEIAMIIALVVFVCIFWVLQETLYTTVRKVSVDSVR